LKNTPPYSYLIPPATPRRAPPVEVDDEEDEEEDEVAGEGDDEVFETEREA